MIKVISRKYIQTQTGKSRFHRPRMQVANRFPIRSNPRLHANLAIRLLDPRNLTQPFGNEQTNITRLIGEVRR